MGIKVGDWVRVVSAKDYSFDDDVVGRELPVVDVWNGGVSLRVDFPHGKRRDGSPLYEPGEMWPFSDDEIAAVAPPAAELYEQPNTPERVRAQHAAERLVSRLTGVATSAVRALHREAYRAAYRAFRACQRGNTP